MHVHSQLVPNPYTIPFPHSQSLFASFPMAGRLCGVVYSPLTWVLKRHHWNPCWRLLSSKYRSRRTSLHSSILSDCFFQIPLTCSSRLWNPLTAPSYDHADDHYKNYCRDNFTNPNCWDSRLRQIYKSHICRLNLNWWIFFGYSLGLTHSDRAGSGYYS